MEYSAIHGKFTEDQELQQKIDHEIKMRDGTAKLLAASKHPAQMLEAAKSLLTSNARMMAYMSELQKRKTDEVLKRKSWLEGNQLPCKAKVCVSDLRIPLMWRDIDHFKNKGDYRRYAVFCIWRVGTQVYDTSLIKEVDRTMTDLTFKDVFVFNDVPNNFECHLEVYCHKLFDDVSIASSHKKFRKKINDLSTSFGRSVGKRLSGLKEDPDLTGSMIVGPKYEQVAHGVLRLADVRDAVTTFDLVLEAPSTSEQSSTPELPLFGNFCCRFVALPLCLVEETVSGQLTVTDSKHNHTDDYWCVLEGLKISCWPSEPRTDDSEPTFTIPVTKDTQVSESVPSAPSRKRMILVYTHGSRQPEYTLEAPCQAVHSKWWDGLQQHLLDQALWQHACDKKMEMKQPTPEQLPSYLRKGSTSLYDEVSMIDTPVKPTQRSSRRKESPVRKIVSRIQSMEEECRPPLRSQRSPRLKDVKYSQSLDLDSLCSSSDSLATNSSDDRVVNVERKSSGSGLRRNVSNSSNSSVASNSPGPPLIRKQLSQKSLDGVVVATEQRITNESQNTAEVEVDAGYSTSTTDGSSLNIEIEASVTSSGVESLTEQCNNIPDATTSGGKSTTGDDTLSDIMERSTELLGIESPSEDDLKGKKDIESDSKDLSSSESQESLSADDVFQEENETVEIEKTVVRNDNEVLDNTDNKLENIEENTGSVSSEKNLENGNSSENTSESIEVIENTQNEIKDERETKTSDEKVSGEKLDETLSVSSSSSDDIEKEEQENYKLDDILNGLDDADEEIKESDNITAMCYESEEDENTKIKNSASTDSIDMISQECEDLLSSIPPSEKHIDGTWGYSYIRAKKAKKEAKLREEMARNGCCGQDGDVNSDTVDPILENSLENDADIVVSKEVTLQREDLNETGSSRAHDSAYDSLQDSMNAEKGQTEDRIPQDCEILQEEDDAETKESIHQGTSRENVHDEIKNVDIETDNVMEPS